MPSPLAHSLIGFTIGLIRFLPRYRQWNELSSHLRSLWRALLPCALLANAPDLDYFFGIFQGNLNRYHQTATHTLVWVVGASLAVWLYSRLRARSQPAARAWSLGLLLALLGSHLLADWLTVDRSPPIGMMLAWPFSTQLYHASFAFFPHGAKQSWAALWSWQNLRLIGVETVITLPLVLGAILSKAAFGRNQRRGRDAAPYLRIPQGRAQPPAEPKKISAKMCHVLTE